MVFYVLVWCIMLSWVGRLSNPFSVQWVSKDMTSTNSLASFGGCQIICVRATSRAGPAALRGVGEYFEVDAG